MPCFYVCMHLRGHIVITHISQHSKVYISLCNGVCWYVHNSPSTLHERSKGELIFQGAACTIQLHVCLTDVVLEESISLVTLEVSKQNIH